MTFSNSSCRFDADPSVLAYKRLAFSSLVGFMGSFCGAGATDDGARPAIASTSLGAEDRDGCILRRSHRVASGLLTNGIGGKELSGQSILWSLQTSLRFSCARSALRAVSVRRVGGNRLDLALCAWVNSLDLGSVNTVEFEGQSSSEGLGVQISKLQITGSALLLAEARGGPSISCKGRRESLMSSGLETWLFYRAARHVDRTPSADRTVIHNCSGEEAVVDSKQLEYASDARAATRRVGEFGIAMREEVDLIAGRPLQVAFAEFVWGQVSEL